MERKIFHGKIKPLDIANALLGEFNRGNFRAQTLGQHDRLVVQVSTRPDAMSGGQTAMTVTIQTIDEGVMIEFGQQAWLGVAASLGVSALSALKNPFSLLGRLDDIAQDIENLTIRERVWNVISKAARSAGASAELSENLKRTTCEYCHVANKVGDPSCVACGAPLGNLQPNTCKHCGFVVKVGTKTCPNCKQSL
ncbi:MAG: zinc ribbon domain-containing protein [Anaerolineales bacterium]|nr:zinc ribbon domain-containing protein [Anaerolineales bacterium]